MIAGLSLQNFRSYSDVSFEFDPGVNIIVGPNASGKTNLLEAVLVVARGHSFRAKDAELLRSGHDWARLDSRGFADEARVVKLQQRLASSGNIVQKTFEINEKRLARLHINNVLPVVLFEPDHLQLLSGPPELRRNFMDDLIEQTVPGYAVLRKNYRRVLSQRNALLKKAPPDLSEQLFVWNVRLAELGGQIAKHRFALVEHCNERIGELYSSIAAKVYSIVLTYDSKFSSENYESQLLRKLESNTALEAARGYTLYGPHREDISVLLNDKPAEQTASRGEVRTLLLALKILELRIIEDARGVKPLLLLDDVFSELDGRRRQALTAFVSNYQTFITTTDADVVIEYFTNKAKIIPMSGV